MFFSDYIIKTNSLVLSYMGTDHSNKNSSRKHYHIFIHSNQNLCSSAAFLTNTTCAFTIPDSLFTCIL